MGLGGCVFECWCDTSCLDRNIYECYRFSGLKIMGALSELSLVLVHVILHWHKDHQFVTVTPDVILGRS